MVWVEWLFDYILDIRAKPRSNRKIPERLSLDHSVIARAPQNWMERQIEKIICFALYGLRACQSQQLASDLGLNLRQSSQAQ